MVITQARSRRKPSGALLRSTLTKRTHMVGRPAAMTKVGDETRKRAIPTKGGNTKQRLFETNVVNAYTEIVNRAYQNQIDESQTLNKPKTPENRQCMRTRSANESNRKVTSVNTPDNEQRTASAGRQADGDSETTSSPATDASTLNGTSPTAAAGAGAKVRQVAPPFQVRTIVN